MRQKNQWDLMRYFKYHVRICLCIPRLDKAQGMCGFALTGCAGLLMLILLVQLM